MTWTPPDQGYPTTGPASKPRGPATLSWRIGHSLWVLAPILSFGCLSLAGYLYVGIRAKRTSWIVAGVLYSVIAFTATMIGGNADPNAPVSDVFVVVFLGTWMTSVVHAVVINGSWLRFRAGLQPWWAQQQQPAWPGVAVHGPMPTQVQGIVPPAQHYYAAPPPAYPGHPQAYMPPHQQANPDPLTSSTPAVDPWADPPQPPGDDLIDVNLAGPEQLAALPAVGPARAAQIVAARQARGGFTSVADFAAAAGLAPHEFAPIRDRLTCTPPAFPQPNHDQPYGRIVDV